MYQLGDRVSHWGTVWRIRKKPRTVLLWRMEPGVYCHCDVTPPRMGPWVLLTQTHGLLAQAVLRSGLGTMNLPAAPRNRTRGGG